MKAWADKVKLHYMYVLSERTVLLFKWFQAMMVLVKKDCLCCLVLQCGTV